MLTTFGTGLLLIASLTAAWLGVQRLALRSRGNESCGEDALAGRAGCQGCKCGAQAQPQAEP